jgi:outer membrane cobalamin receptor
LQYRPRHRTSAEAQYSSASGLGASLTVLSVAGQLYYSRTDPSVFRELPDYVVANVRVSQALLSGKLRLHAGVDNLFDERYEEEYGSPRPTRVVYGGLSVMAK